MHVVCEINWLKCWHSLTKSSVFSSSGLIWPGSWRDLTLLRQENLNKKISSAVTLLLLLYFLTVDDLSRIGKKSKEKYLSKNGLKRQVEVTIHLSCRRSWRNGYQPSASLDGVLAQSKRAICVRMRASAERQMLERIKSDGGKLKTCAKLQSFWKPFRC